MKKFYLCTVFLCFLMVLMTKTSIVRAQVDTVTITIYADLRDWVNMTADPGNPDSTANAHNIGQFASYDPGVLYITGHWSPESNPGSGDWSFITMDSVKPNIFKVTFKYGVGYFKGNITDDPDLLEDNPGWYFAPTSDWSTAEWVPAPCNVAWDIQRIFQINIYKADTVVAFKYGVCDPVTLCSLDIPDICVQEGVPEAGISKGIYVFPNPASDMITIKNANKAVSAKIFDITGKMVKQVRLNGAEPTISLGNLSSQLYLLQVQNSDGSMFNTKIMKK